MPRAPLDRITITIPRALLAAADRLARELDRSRSWVVAEGVRRLVEGQGTRDGTGAPRQEPLPARRAAPREAAPGAAPARARPAPYPLDRLRADLQLTPEARVLAAERALLQARPAKPRFRVQRIITFDSYEDYADWKSWEGAQS